MRAGRSGIARNQTAHGQLVPRLQPGVRLASDDLRGQAVLLHPEGVALLNQTAAAVLHMVDGARTVAAITTGLGRSFDDVRPGEVMALLGKLQEARLIELAPPRSARAGRPAASADAPALSATGTPADQVEATRRGLGVARPLGLLAELTHRCPLHCPYCSNLTALTAAAAELPTATWLEVFAQARRLGVWQLHLSGGEPLLRRDLDRLAGEAHQLGLYVNLVTSGIGLSPTRASALADAGVDHVQLSLQGATAPAADRIAGAKAHQRRLAAATAIRGAGMVLTINVVLHRSNIGEIAALAAELGADRLELAHAQYYGWAPRNRAALLPTAAQADQAETAVKAARARHPQLAILYVTCDYHEPTPKPCMHGWASRQLTITPDGTALPCPAAGIIPDLAPPNIRNMPLASIWADSEAFTRFRGTSWLPDPCRTCPAHTTDFGGCRCQAWQFLGDPAATDPVCQYSPDREVVYAAIAAAAATPAPPLVYRTLARPAATATTGIGAHHRWPDNRSPPLA